MGYLTPFISYFGLPTPHKGSGIVMMALPSHLKRDEETQGEDKSLLHSCFYMYNPGEQL